MKRKKRKKRQRIFMRGTRDNEDIVAPLDDVVQS